MLLLKCGLVYFNTVVLSKDIIFVFRAKLIFNLLRLVLNHNYFPLNVFTRRGSLRERQTLTRIMKFINNFVNSFDCVTNLLDFLINKDRISLFFDKGSPSLLSE